MKVFLVIGHFICICKNIYDSGDPKFLGAMCQEPQVNSKVLFLIHCSLFSLPLKICPGVPLLLNETQISHSSVALQQGTWASIPSCLMTAPSAGHAENTLVTLKYPKLAPLWGSFTFLRISLLLGLCWKFSNDLGPFQVYSLKPTLNHTF